MKKARFFLLMTFVLVFAAGLTAGRFWAAAPRPPRPGGSSWIARELGLSAEQRQQMESIWKEAGEKAKAIEDQRRVLTEKRDAAVQEMLSEEQRLEYRTIMEDFDRSRSDLNTEREVSFQEAVERTKAMLTAQQREKYEHMLTRFPRGERGGRPPSRRPRGTRLPPDTSVVNQVPLEVMPAEPPQPPVER